MFPSSLPPFEPGGITPANNGIIRKFLRPLTQAEFINMNAAPIVIMPLIAGQLPILISGGIICNITVAFSNAPNFNFRYGPATTAITTAAVLPASSPGKFRRVQTPNANVSGPTSQANRIEGFTNASITGAGTVIDAMLYAIGYYIDAAAP